MLVSDAPWGVTAFLSHHDEHFTARSLDYLAGIFGFTDDDGLAGYPACDWQIDNIWDVVFVHVLEAGGTTALGPTSRQRMRDAAWAG
jgi:hypothetical protein